MRPLSEMSHGTAADIVALFADIDDTITDEGRLGAKAYAALEQLHEAGLKIALITGRPAGWCDMVARFWPVDGVVGENGALYFAYDRAAKKMMRAWAVDREGRKEARAGFARIASRCLAEVPGCAVSADQPYRETDLAIDFCEDVPPLDEDAVARIKAVFEGEGATAKISSIHVNGWFGNWDKLSMSRRFAAERLGLDLDAARARVVYCGDSPNDCPMFAHFPNSCGVANIHDFDGRLEAEPGWVASARGGAGFVEIAERLLEARRA